MRANEGKLFPSGVFIVCSCLSWLAQICAGNSVGAVAIGARALFSLGLPSLVQNGENFPCLSAEDGDTEELGRVGRESPEERMGEFE